MKPMSLKDFSLLKEDDNHYVVGHPQGKSILVCKGGLSKQGKELISKLKRHQEFSDGSEPIDDPNQVEQANMPNPAPSAPNESDGQELQEEASPAPDVAVQQQPQVDANGFLPVETLNAPIEEAKKSIEEGVSAEQKMGDVGVKAYAEIPPIQETPDQIFQRRQEKQVAIENAMMDGRIDPNRILNNNHLSNAIAGAISGFGAGLAGSTTNPYLDNLNKAIDRDIDAQKNDQSKLVNLWKMNKDMMGSEMEANLATRNMYLGAAKAKMLGAQSAALGPEAKARMAQTVLGLNQQINNNNQSMALLKFSNQGGMDSPAPLINNRIHDRADRQKALEEVGKLQQMVQLKKGLVQSFNDLNSKWLAGTFDPRDRESAINTFAGPLAKAAEGRFNLEESKNQIGALLQAKLEGAETTANKRARIDQFFDSLIQTPTLQANHIDPNKFMSTNLKSVNNARLPGTIVKVKR